MAEGQESASSVAVIDADGFVGRGNRLTFQQLPARHRPGLRGIHRVTTVYLSDLAQIEWLEDPAAE